MRNPVWLAVVFAFAAQAAPGPISFNAPKSFPVLDAASATASLVHTYSGRKQPTFTPTDKYMLFRFTGSVLKHDVVDWAYDPSRVHIHAGYHGSGQVEPEDLGALEPSTADATGLPAMALGAPGVRRWRAARTDANKQTETAQ